MKRKRKITPPQDPYWDCFVWESLRGLFDHVLETGTLDTHDRVCINGFLRFLPRPSVQDERAARAAAYIRERFARTGKPVSATAIAKYLKEDEEILVLRNERFVAPGDPNITRAIVIKRIYPLLHRDKSLTCTGRGPAAGWKPRA